MNKYCFNPIPYITIFVCMVAVSMSTFAQQSAIPMPIGIDSTKLKLIRITKTKQIVKNEKENFQRFIDSVVIEHDGIVMNCDSAFLYQDKNIVEAFGKVDILKSGSSEAHASYMKYNGYTHTAILQGDVSIIDQANTLFAEEVTYNIKTKIGKYTKGGSLQNGDVTVNSEVGTYNGFSQQSYFKTNVVVTHPEYTIESEEITYNIKSKVVKLLDKSTVISGNSTIYTKGGTYDTKTKLAVFHTRTTVETDDQIITADHLVYNDLQGSGKAKGNVVIIDPKNDSRITSKEAEYNKTNSWGKAVGNVIIEQEGGKSLLYAAIVEYNKATGYAKAMQDVVFIDTLEKTKLIAGIVEYNDFSKFMLATEHPKLITLADNDSLFVRADTMLSMRQSDTAMLSWRPVMQGKKIVGHTYNLLFADSSYLKANLTPDPKMIIANHHVKLYSDSMQAVCDSLCYLQSDSTFRLYKSPILWSKNQQASADSIHIQLNNGKVHSLHLIKNALMVSATGYETYYDQVAGQKINVYMQNGQIQYAHVDGNAQSIYHAKDDNEAFIGLNKAESAEMKMYFENKQINRIVFLNDPSGTTYPIDKIAESAKYLSEFKLLDDKKPTSKKDIMSN